MALDLVVRDVGPDDAEAIVSILNPIIAAGVYTVLEGPLTAEFERQYIESFPVRGVFHVAECPQDREIVGLQSIEPFATYTHAFDHVAVIGTYVSLAHQRQGIGRRLSEATFEAAKQKGYGKIFTYVRADSPGTLAFYIALGFSVVGTARNQAKIGSGFVDEVIIEKFL